MLLQTGVMKSDELRKIFLEFFKERGHSIERPASLTPENDPSLLFTGAGMNQFKELFFGRGNSDLKRAVTCQRCLRATDIENVGRTTKHLTFIEMLGNFSFGDYFKEGAILLAWEFMLEVLKLPKEKFLITVYKDDDESFRIWEKKIGIPRKRIFPMGEEHNFWNMGKTGPCGPCSEIIIDRGEKYGCGKSSCGPACECDRHLELWNLVFTQFDRQKDGRLEPLRQKNIDTGMGLERIASVMQNVLSVFDIDLIQPIVSRVGVGLVPAQGDRKGRPYDGKAGDMESAARIIADHIRAITFCIADGVLPSNEGRGYVLRKLIRRAVERGGKLGRKKPFLYGLVPLVISKMSDFYPDLNGRENALGLVVKAEEERFFTVFQRLPELEEKISELVKGGIRKLPGEFCFRYYDTYGIPLETIREAAQSMNAEIDEDGFRNAMNAQRKRARDSSRFAGTQEEMLQVSGKTKFTGYGELESKAKILTIIRDGNEVKSAKKGEETRLVTDITPFYGEAGGQVGDEGEITGKKGRMRVTNTTRAEKTIIHHGVVTDGTLRKGEEATLTVNRDRRLRIAGNHTVTHILHYSLRQILGEHVSQCGSSVGVGGLHFDFTHSASVSVKELSKIEERVNDLIMKNASVETLELPFEEAKKLGAIALFTEKYEDIVRVVKIGDYSLELCGGTHTTATGEIGIFIIESEASVAAGVRRISARSGHSAYLQINKGRLVLSEIGDMLRADISDLPGRVENIQQSTRLLEKKLETLQVKEVISGVEDYLSHAKEIRGVKVIARIEDGLSAGSLRQLTDVLKKKMKSGIVVLGTAADGKVLLNTGVTDDLTKQGWHAGKLIKEVASIVGGSGGGRADFAQAGGKNVHRLKDAMESVPEIIKKAK